MIFSQVSSVPRKPLLMREDGLCHSTVDIPASAHTVVYMHERECAGMSAHMYGSEHRCVRTHRQSVRENRLENDKNQEGKCLCSNSDSCAAAAFFSFSRYAS